MYIKDILKENIDKGETSFEFAYEPDSINRFIKDINTALRDLGYTDKYRLEVKGGVVTINLGKEST